MGLAVKTILSSSEEVVSHSLLDRQLFGVDIRRLSRVSNWRSAAVIVWEWLAIVAAFYGAMRSHSVIVYMLAAVVVATRQHAMGVLVHEAAHYRLFTNRLVNDFISDVLLAFPLGISTSIYRKHHLLHHRQPNSADDPDVKIVMDDDDWEWPKLPAACAVVFLKTLLGLDSPWLIRVIYHWSPYPSFIGRPTESQFTLNLRERISLVCVVAALATVLTGYQLWMAYLLLWVLPTFTVLAVILRLRALAEHYGVESEHELNVSRCVVPYW